jgi:hypothetical protein
MKNTISKKIRNFMHYLSFEKQDMEVVMVRHIVSWSFKDEFTAQQRKEYAQKIKADLEALPDCIEGIIEIKVYTELLPASNRDLVLYSLFESENALEQYQVHPEHMKVSDFVRSVVKDRVCIDYQE